MSHDLSPPSGFDVVADLVQHDNDQFGYRAVNFWPEATPENARIEAINPEFQAQVEELLWSLRQDRQAAA